MRAVIILVTILLTAATLFAEQSPYIEVTAPGNRQLKLALDSPRSGDQQLSLETGKEMTGVIAFDMNMSGVVSAETRETLPLPGGIILGEVDFVPWLTAGFDLLVRSEFSLSGDDLTVEFRLFDVLNRKLLTAKRYLGKKKDLRRFAHSFADEILLSITGEKGCFTTRIAYISSRSGNKELYIMDWDGYNSQQLTSNGSINLNPDFSPDGRELIFTSYKRGNPDLFRRALSSTTEIPLSIRKGLNISATWSPDGTKIALTLSKDGDAEIYTIDKDGANPVRLTVSPALEVSPAWSPDGGQIVFVSDRLGKPQVFVMDAKGGNVRRLTAAGGYNVTPRWSPKGDKVAYVRMGGGFHVYVINIDGTGDTQLTTSGSFENPVWSPDGRFIAAAARDGIYVMRPDGSGLTRVSKGGGAFFQPAWSPR